ncbi:KH domain-containing protein [candidate division KSB1 bacterium]|nr:KH domain-containing protein [candidate division KSB1 bacterium]
MRRSFTHNNFLRRMRTNYLIAALLIFMGVLPSSHAIMPRSNPKKAAYDFRPARLSILSITMKESQSHVEILASEQFRGRETGKPGQWLAAKYIATEFANYGLQPPGRGHSFYQDFSIRRCDLKQAALWIETEAHPLADVKWVLGETGQVLESLVHVGVEVEGWAGGHPSEPRQRAEERLGDHVIFHLQCAEEDKGRLIGRDGRVANAMRSLLHVASTRAGVRATLNIE